MSKHWPPDTVVYFRRRGWVPRVRRRRRSRVSRVQIAVICAAAVAGLALGVLPELMPKAPSGWAEAPIAWNEVQEVPEPERSAEDLAWERRAAELDRPPAASARAGGAGASPSTRSGQAFGFCHSGGGTNCVVDGDTFYIGGAKVRIAGIDAPETHPPRCAREAELGAAATQTLQALLSSGAVTMSGIGRDRDTYGRLLRNVAVDGVDVGGAMIGAGVAREYGRGRRGWCG